VTGGAADIADRRLANQHLARPRFTAPSDVVAALGAVQAQDYAGAKWAIALRGRGITDAAVEAAVAAGTILRTHVLRPTWHFVTPADIGWMLALTAPRIRAAMASSDRKLGLDATVVRRSNAAITRALRDGAQLTRQELADALDRAGIDATGTQRLAHLMLRAELDGIVCSGGRRGKQFTYALLAERAPQPRTLSRDESLLELTMRYLGTRGPATPHDLAWWSGLTVADARRGIALAEPRARSDTIDGRACWFLGSRPPATDADTAHLLPNFDEYFIGFTERSAPLDAHTIVIGGEFAGTWRRAIRKDAATIELQLSGRATPARRRAIAAAAERFAAFLQLPVEVAYR
jgi:hypothetical protein